MNKITDINEVEQIIYLLGIEFNRVDMGNVNVFDIPVFGVKILFYTKVSDFKPELIKGFVNSSWRIVLIESESDLEEKRMEIIWELMRSGYIHYLRMEQPRTFKKLISLNGWDKKIINKRLEIYGEDQKYNYFRDLNKDALRESSTFILSIDPGFFDFLI